MKVLLTTQEGWMRNKTHKSKEENKKKNMYLVFSGDDAPIKAVRALIQKYGITPEEIQGDI